MIRYEYIVAKYNLNQILIGTEKSHYYESQYCYLSSSIIEYLIMASIDINTIMLKMFFCNLVKLSGNTL